MAIQSVKNTTVPNELLVGDFFRLVADPFNEVIEKLTAQDICTCAKVCKDWSIHLYSGPYADALWELLFKNRYPTPFTFNTDYKETWAQAYKTRTMLHTGLEGGMYSMNRGTAIGQKYRSCLLASDNDKIISCSRHDESKFFEMKIWGPKTYLLQSVSGLAESFFVDGKILFSLQESPSDFKMLCPIENSNQYCFQSAFQWDNEEKILSLKIEDGRLIARSESVIKIYELSSQEGKQTLWECKHSLAGPVSDEKEGIVVGQGKLFCTDTNADQIKVWDWKTLKPLDPIARERIYPSLHYANGLLFSVEDLEGEENVIAVRKDLEKDELLYRLEGYEDGTISLESVGNKLISYNPSGGFEIWNMDSGHLLHRLPIELIDKSMWTIMDEYLIFSGHESSLDVWNIDSGKVLMHLLLPRQSIVEQHVFMNDQVGLVTSSAGFIGNITETYSWNLHASDDEILKDFVKILEDADCIDKAMMERFCRLSPKTKNAIYEELYLIMKPHLKIDYWGCGEDAFMGKLCFFQKNGFYASFMDQIHAIQTYLKNKNRR